MKKIFSILPFLSLAFCLNAQSLTWKNINLVTVSADNKDLKSDANAFQATALSSQVYLITMAFKKESFLLQ